MSLAGQFRGDAQAETLAQETALAVPSVKKPSLAEQFSSGPLADTVGRNLNAAQTTTPDQSLNIARLADQTGLDLDAVARNYDDILTQVKQRDTDPVDIARNNPSLAKWLTKPENAALGTNDLSILKRIEKMIPSGQALVGLTDPLRQAEAEVVRTPGTILSGTGELLGATTRMTDRLTGGALSSIDEFLQRHVGSPPDWADPTLLLKGAAKPFKEFAEDFSVPEDRQNIVTDISGAVGQLGAQVAQAIMAPQTLVPSLLAQGADIQGQKVEQAGEVGTAESDAAILASAGVTAMLEKIGIGQLLNRIPPSVKNDILRKAADIAVAGGIEAVQELVENISHNVITQQLVNPEQEIVDAGTWREVTAAGGAAGFLRAVVQAATKGRSREKGQSEQEALDAVVEANDSTWLKQNAPEKLQEFIADAKKAGVDTVYLPADAAATYFQSANLDMGQVLTAAGVDRQDVLAAQATGGDIPIPLEIYTVSLGEHHKAGLRDFARISPESTPPGEVPDAESERQENDAMIRRFLDSAQDDSAGKIKDDVVGQLIAAGQDRDTAEKYGILIDKAFTTLGTRSGIDPLSLYQKYGLRIGREGVEQAPPDISIDPYLEAIRSGKLPTERQAFGPSFLEALKAAGGIKDEGGELASRDVAKQAPGVVRDTGMSADQVLSWAYENGYIDTPPTEYLDRFDPNAPTENAVYDLIDRELGGKKIYSERNANAALSSFLRGAEQISAEMEKIGIDITQPNEDIRRALQTGRESAITLSQYTPEDIEFFRSMGIPVNAKAQPRPEPPAEAARTVGGGTPREGWGQATVVTGTDGKPATIYRGSQDGTTSAGNFADDQLGAATGHPSSALGVWFSADRGDASRYGKVGEYKLDLRNPKTYNTDDAPNFETPEEFAALRKSLQAAGHDGIVLDFRDVGGPVQFVVFSPESVIPASRTFAQTDVTPASGKPYSFIFARNPVSAPRALDDQFAQSIEPAGRYMIKLDPGVEPLEGWESGEITFESPLVIDWGSGGYSDPDNWKQVLNKKYGGKKGAALSKAILADGYDSIITVKDGETSEMMDLRVIGRPAKKFAQDQGVERGQIRIAPSGVDIALFEKANLSTFLHESGHFFLEVMGDVATNPDAPQQIKDDYAALLKWLGVESRDQIGVEQHEKMARGFESYLGEGKAPSPELTTLFSRFRAWMISIYKSLKNLNVELSGEVRGVFDRMIATDDEIAAVANQTPAGEFRSQQEAGMTDSQWAKYQELLVESRAETEGQLTARAYDEIKRERESWWKEKSAEMAAEVEAEANEMPVYRAWSFLADGKYPDGRGYDGALEHQKLDKSVLVSMYGQEFLNQHLRYKGIYQQEGGLHPNTVASQFGYESASTMIEQLAGAPKKSDYVKNETKRRMLELYGDMMNDGSMPEQAMKAAHNDRRFKALEVELQALGRIIGRVPPKLAQMRQLADSMIGNKKPREIQPYLYLKAERKAARDYAELAQKGQRAQAYEAKQRQLLNGLLYDRAWKAQDEVKSIVDYANKLMKKPKQEKLAKAGGSYLQQINDILAAYQFRKLPLKQVDRQEGLRQWVDKMQEEGDITAVPDSVIRRVETQAVNYQNVPLEELRGVRDSLKNIDHLSVLKNKLLKKGEQKDKDEARDEMLDRLRETNPDRKTLAASDFAKTTSEQMGDKLHGFADASWRPETAVEAMDGGESGPWHDYLWEPANDARAMQNELREKVGTKLEEATNALDKKWQNSLGDEWQIAGRRMTRRDIIGMALNLGNDGNRDKMMRGGYIENGVRRPYTAEEVEGAISHLTEQDWAMVQSVWDTVNSLWPDIVAQQQRLSGLPPEKVEASPFTVNTSDGKTVRMAGGYFPVAYDPRFSAQGETQADNAASALLAGKFTRAATPKGHLKERTDFAAPIQLDYQSVLTQHVDSVITDLSHREFLKQAQWIITDAAIKNNLMERIGETGYNSLRGFINHTVGADRPIPESSMKAWHRASDAIMSNTAVYALGFRAATAWGNMVVAPIQAAARVKPSYMVKGFVQFYSNLQQSTDFVHQLSPFMRHRARDLDASYVEVMNTLGGNKSVRRQIARASMQVHRWADYLAVHGIWLGRYQQAVDAGAEPEEAARLADKAIRQTQTAGAPKDLAGIERDPTYKIFRMFIGPMVIMNNRIRESVTRKGVIKTWPEAFGTMVAAWFLPAVIFELAVGRGPEDDEPEDWYLWAATKIGLYPAQTIPVVRDIASAVEAKILDKYVSPKVSPLTAAGVSIVDAFDKASKEIEAADDIDDIDAGKISKSTLRALGPIFGLPTNQIDITGSFIYDVMTKEYEPDSPLDYRYLLVRRPKEEQ